MSGVGACAAAAAAKLYADRPRTSPTPAVQHNEKRCRWKRITCLSSGSSSSSARSRTPTAAWMPRQAVGTCASAHSHSAPVHTRRILLPGLASSSSSLCTSLALKNDHPGHTLILTLTLTPTLTLTLTLTITLTFTLTRKRTRTPHSLAPSNVHAHSHSLPLQ